MQKILKNERGSVALFVLLSALFFLVVVTGVAVSFKNKEAQIDSQFEKIKLSYEKDANQVYDEVIKNNIDISTDYGTIEIIWLQGNSNTITSTPNQPNMYNGFEKVAWRDNGTEFTPTQNSDWYSYNSITGKEDNTTSKWANSKNTADGSYFVWIPRFAYRITYWDSVERNNITGYFDGRGMVDVDGNIVTKEVNGEKKQITLDSGINTVTKNGVQYIVHPAFDNSIDNGGWRNKLSGFWVAKYEMSREDYDSTSNTWNPTTISYGGGNEETNNTTTRTVSKPNVTSWRNIKIGFSYTNSYNYDRTKESHLMKNSEWGAVAYLTHSQYGRNGHEISVNQSTDFITGAGRGLGTNDIYNDSYGTDIGTGGPTLNQRYNGTIGKASSSTGNIHGIYDLSGGAHEYVASFDEKSTSIKLTENGWAELSTNKASTEYATAYNNETDTEYGILVYNVGKVGDATKEVMRKTNFNNWFSDYGRFARLSVPFFRRGGYCKSVYNSGVFYSCSAEGDGTGTSFRIVLAQ